MWAIIWYIGVIPAYVLLCRAMTYDKNSKDWNNKDRVISTALSLLLSWVIVIGSLISLFVQMIGKPPNPLENFLKKHVVPIFKKLEPKDLNEEE